MESEYTAMLMALRSVIPLLAIIESVTKGLHYHKHKLLTFKATVHQDNQGALILDKLETGRYTPRSKFYTQANFDQTASILIIVSFVI